MFDRFVPNLGSALASALAGAGNAVAWVALAELRGSAVVLGFGLVAGWLVATLLIARWSVRGSIGLYLLPIRAALSAVWTHQNATNCGQTADIL